MADAFRRLYGVETPTYPGLTTPATAAAGAPAAD